MVGEVSHVMVPCSLSELLHLFQVCEEDKCPCTVEYRVEGSYLDVDVSATDEIPLAKYEEFEGGGDCITVSMGTLDLSFEVPSQYFKDIGHRQISMVIANDHCHAFFNTGRLSNQAMRKVRWYREDES